jgi:hypothetical protein
MQSTFLNTWNDEVIASKQMLATAGAKLAELAKTLALHAFSLDAALKSYVAALQAALSPQPLLLPPPVVNILFQPGAKRMRMDQLLKSDAAARAQSALLTALGVTNRPSFALIASCTLAENGNSDLRAATPFLDGVWINEVVFPLVLIIMIAAVNRAHTVFTEQLVKRTAELVARCHSTLSRLQEATEPSSFTIARTEANRACESLQHAAAATVEALRAKRTFVKLSSEDENTSEALFSRFQNGQLCTCLEYNGTPIAPDRVNVSVDPRMVYMEFVMASLLRPRQGTSLFRYDDAVTLNLLSVAVELVTGMLNASHHGSAAYQMIMGQGKTSVVAPLLGLCLADRPGVEIAAVVVPPPLLDQSRDALRAALLTPLLARPVVTLRFDRSVAGCPPVVTLDEQDASKPGSRTQPISKRRRGRVVRSGARPASSKKPSSKYKSKSGNGGSKNDVDAYRIEIPHFLLDAVSSRLVTAYASSAGAAGYRPEAVDAEFAKSFPFPKSRHDAGLAEAVALLETIVETRKAGGIIVTTPDAIKSLLLRYVDLLQGEKRSATIAADIVEAQRKRSTSPMPDYSDMSGVKQDGASSSTLDEEMTEQKHDARVDEAVAKDSDGDETEDAPSESSEAAAVYARHALVQGLTADVLASCLCIFRETESGQRFGVGVLDEVS